MSDPYDREEPQFDNAVAFATAHPDQLAAGAKALCGLAQNGILCDVLHETPGFWAAVQDNSDSFYAQMFHAGIKLGAHSGTHGGLFVIYSSRLRDLLFAQGWAYSGTSPSTGGIAAHFLHPTPRVCAGCEHLLSCTLAGCAATE